MTAEVISPEATASAHHIERHVASVRLGVRGASVGLARMRATSIIVPTASCDFIAAARQIYPDEDRS